MNILEKYNLKLGDKIITNGNASGIFDVEIKGWLTGEIIAITPEVFYVGSNNPNFDGSRPSINLPSEFKSKNYSRYKYSWVIDIDNQICSIRRLTPEKEIHFFNITNFEKRYGN